MTKREQRDIMRKDRTRRALREAAEAAVLSASQGNARNAAFHIENPDSPAWRNPELAAANGFHLMPTPRRAYVDARRTFCKPRTRCVGVAPGTENDPDSTTPTFLRILADGTQTIETVASIRKPRNRSNRENGPRSVRATTGSSLAESECARQAPIGNIE